MASVRWYGHKVSAEVKAAGIRGLRLAAEHVLEEANRTVPIEEGTLERSGTVSVDEQRGAAAVSYDTPYAVRQHEAMDFRHAPGRTAKYLERPLNAERATVFALMAAQMRRALR